ncbi:MAG: TonB-dependent receptor [Gammaproteobacteria bacterium]|nr:TonB-dependent receptor [Gammaproteobacteria bacterium]NIR82498.1 TonB-dependent receptor [Gammaproteobacteria bacterium]NIR88494.1 TonB-dependent receptor [Gammaproteobacteria bacterium]NIU03634.1 TonB-dependent receptor [Gammaproteobacteria bacterium]NIV50986.1 TonB-dependent receptor [Gammaproteobacteria bacterium]
MNNASAMSPHPRGAGGVDFSQRGFVPRTTSRAGCSPRLLCALVAVSGAALAQEDSGDEAAQVPEVIVSGTRSPQSTVTVPASISVITREEIEASGAPHLVDVLRGRGAVQVSDSFGDGSRAQVGMRGFGETAHANTLVLVDGRRLNNADIGPPDLNSVALKDIERIEIIQGSAGTLFGDQAVGGVINIIIRKPRRFAADVEGGFGSYDRRVVRGQIGGRLTQELSYRLSAERLWTDNYRDHNDKDYGNYAGRLELEHGRGSIFTDFQLVDEKLELPGGLTETQVAEDRRQSDPFFADDELDTDTRAARGGLTQHLYGPWSLEGEFAYRRTDADGTFFASPFDSRRKQREITPRLTGVYPNRFGEAVVTLGADLRWADFDLESPSIGTTRNRQDVQSVYGQAVIPFAPRWSLTLGARKAWVENDLTTMNPFGLPDFPDGVQLDDDVFVTEVGLSFRPTRAWRLFVRRDENFRFAKADEQSFTQPGTVGLDTQTGVSWETGAEWRTGRNVFKAVGFHLVLDDEIAFDPTVVGPSPFLPGANVNLDRTVRTGFILSGVWQANRHVGLSGDFTYTDAEFDSGGLKGNTVPFVAETVVRTGVDLRLTDQWHAFWEVQSIGDRFLIGDNANALPKLDGYTVQNVRIAYRYRGWRVSARINNITDEEYVDFASPFSFFPAPERNFWLTLSYRYE